MARIYEEEVADVISEEEKARQTAKEECAKAATVEAKLDVIAKYLGLI